MTYAQHFMDRWTKIPSSEVVDVPALANAPKAAPAVDDDGDDDHISPGKSMLKIIFLFPRWDMLISWRVYIVWVCINICNYIYMYILYLFYI